MGCCDCIRNCCVSSLKSSLWLLNLILALLGAGLAVIGGVLMVKFAHVTFVFGTLSLIGLIATGVVLCLLAMWGCWGASKQSPCVLMTYSSILALLLIAEIVFCVMILQFTGKVGGAGLTGGIEHAINCTYTTCCLRANTTTHGCNVEMASCGQLPSVFVPKACPHVSWESYEKGASEWLKKEAKPGSIAAIVVCGVQGLIVFLSCCLSRFKRLEVELEDSYRPIGDGPSVDDVRGGIQSKYDERRSYFRGKYSTSRRDGGGGSAKQIFKSTPKWDEYMTARNASVEESREEDGEDDVAPSNPFAEYAL